MAETQKQEKEERIDLKIGVPVSVGVGLAGDIFGDAEEAIPTPDFSPQPQGGDAPGQGGGFQFGGGEEEDMMASMMQGMGEPPPGVDLDKMRQMVSQAASEGQQMRAQAEAERAEAPVPGQGGGWRPTEQEAYEEQMRDREPLTSKEEFREGRDEKSPSWWKKLVYGLTAGVAGETEYGFEAKLDRAYKEHIAPQMRARAEQERKAGVMEEAAGAKKVDVGDMVGMGKGVLMIDDAQVGSFAGLIKGFREAEEAGSVNLRTLLGDKAPDQELSAEFAAKIIPVIIQRMKDGRYQNEWQVWDEDPELAKMREDYKLKNKMKGDAAKATKENQKSEDLLARMNQLTNNPEQLGSYLSMIGEDVPSGGDFSAELEALLGPETGGDPDAQVAAAKASTVSDFGGNYVWQVASLNPEHQEWAENYLKREGLSFRSGAGPVKKYKGTYRSIREGIRKDQNKTEAPKVTVSQEDIDAYALAAQISKVEARNTLRPTAKEQREAKKDFKDAQKRKYDEFMWYHFPDEHLATLESRKESQVYINEVTQKTQRDELAGGGAVQGFGNKVDRAKLQEYAVAKGITLGEALEEARGNPNIRLVGME